MTIKLHLSINVPDLDILMHFIKCQMIFSYVRVILFRLHLEIKYPIISTHKIDKVNF